MICTRNKPVGVTTKLVVANLCAAIVARRRRQPLRKLPCMELQAVVDPRFLRLMLPRRLARRLHLTEIERIPVEYPDGQVRLRTKVAVIATVLGRRGFYHAIVEPHRSTAGASSWMISTL
jgi:hypothetical protein